MITVDQLNEVFPGRSGVYYDLYRDGITQGTLNKWLTCPESARLGIQYGLAGPRNAFPLEFGSVFHEALELGYGIYKEQGTFGDVKLNFAGILINLNRKMQEAENRDVNKAILGVGTTKRIEEIEYTYKLAEVVWRRYFRAWHEDFETMKWVGLEQEFDFQYENLMGKPLGHACKIPLRGKMDGVFEDDRGELWLFETKTSSVIDNDATMLKLPMNMQVGLYSLVVKQLYGREPVGVLYNMVKRPMQRRGKSETEDVFLNRVAMEIDASPDTYFRRIEATISGPERDLFRAELGHIIQDFEDWYLGLKPHYRNTNSCSIGPFTCEYLEACSLNQYDQLAMKEFVYPELPEYRKAAESISANGAALPIRAGL